MTAGQDGRLGLWGLALLLLLLPRSLSAQPAGCQTLQTVVPNCTCEASVEDASLPTLNCRGLGLGAVPAINGQYPGLVRHLALTDNAITDIPSRAFQGLRIFHLDITGNPVVSVSDEAFLGLEASLQELQLGGNRSSPTQAPWAAIKVLTGLRKLEVDNFRVPSNALRGSDILTAFPNLTHLKVDSFNLATVYPDFVTPRSQTLKSVIFNNNQFRSLPLQALQHLPQVETLHFTQAAIEYLSTLGFQQMTKLKELDLSNNKINVLESNCFFGVTNVLETLNLETNAFTDSSQLAYIRNLTALKTLKLGMNSLTSLPTQADFLKDKTGLQVLHLNSNSLKSLPDGAFDAVQGQLLELNLGYNQINSTAPGALRNLGALQKLNLERQTIGNPLVLPDFSPLSSLRELVLSGTRFDPGSWQQIGKLTSLTMLVLSQTGISSVPDFALGPLTGLQELHLDGNSLSNLGQAALYGPRHSLRKLILSSNQLTGLSRCILSDFSTNVTLSLLGNNLHCNCTLRWLLRFMQNGSVTLDTGLETCSTPPSLGGQLLTSLRPEELPCDDNQLEPRPPCQVLYTTTTTVAPTTTPAPTTPTLPSTTLALTIVGANRESMNIEWQVGDDTHISHFYVEHTALPSGSRVTSPQLPKGARFYNVVSLSPGQNYEVCVHAVKTNGQAQSRCTTGRTEGLPPTTPSTQAQNTQGNDMPLTIALAVVGALVFILLIIVLYLFFARRKKSNKDLSPEAIQPRTFARSELPTMGYDSRRFQRPKKKSNENNNAQPEAIQVSVVSDGKDGGPGNLGRVSAGSYQALDERAGVHDAATLPLRHTYVNEGGAYANDSDLRPLPRLPPGYQPEGYRPERGYRAEGGHWPGEGYGAEGGHLGHINPAFRHSDPRNDERPASYQEIVL